MGEVVGSAGVAGGAHQMDPFAAGVAGLLLQFTACRLLRGFPLLHHTGRQLVAGAVESVAVLQLHDEMPVFGYGDYVHPVGVFEHVKFGVHPSVGKAHLVMPDPQPRRTRHYNLALQRSPAPRVGCFVYIVFPVHNL